MTGCSGCPKKEDTLLMKELDEEAVTFPAGSSSVCFWPEPFIKMRRFWFWMSPQPLWNPVSENAVYQKYLELTRGCTSVFISHRLASTRFCDRILFLEEGKIVEEGTHEQLLEKGGKYAEAFAVQSRYYQEHPEEEGEEVLP